ncbi:MAG: formate-dependent phosphoribosylglycinamide formyltransferase [Gammaproteobacteria bacterium]|nr:formate-dependent phosphoribosylglycinamide formyltransferase [Gammaproteobacteria bacterium]
MQIGTPLSKNALKIMFLGSGELGKEVIIALQRYGVETIAVDRYENAPGHQVAHRSHVIDMSDPKALRELVEQEQPHIIVPEIEAIATDELASIERDGLAEVIPKARATQLTMNREGIRRLAAEELELPTSRYAFAESINELKQVTDGAIGYPCIIKPVMSSSGKGQSLVNSSDELEAAWTCAIEGGRVNQGKVIVEEKIEFDFEITLLTVRSLGENGDVVTSFCDPIGHIQKAGDYVESWQPQAMTETALKKSQNIAKKITDDLGGRGLFGVELFVSGDNVWFSEVSPRPHDTGMVTMVTQRQNEFELHARAILGLPVSVDAMSPGASAVIYGGMDEKGIAFDGLDAALHISQTEVRLFGKPEAFVKRRMGVALAYANNIDVARKNAKLASEKIVPTKGGDN